MTNERQARAFVPGHVTGFFSTHRAADPAATGSTGAGIALADGARVTVKPGESVRLNGAPVEMTPVRGVLAALSIDASVHIETPLPVGAGFGVSGAAALGTALAGNQAFDCGRSLNDLITVAHCAEVQAETGLGDVVAQAAGGVSIRLAPGGPAHGDGDGIPAVGRIEYLSKGELSTREVLTSDTETLSAAGEKALSQLIDTPRLETLLSVSRTFARESDLLGEEVTDILEAVTSSGGDAAMAMLGRTAFATGTGLSDAGFDPQVTQIHHGGAHLLPVR